MIIGFLNFRAKVEQNNLMHFHNREIFYGGPFFSYIVCTG